jgi:prepilin-type N-terminal cleavage/methylation domain-containing protein
MHDADLYQFETVGSSNFSADFAPRRRVGRKSAIRNPQSARGFTLTELLVVIAIIGILVSLVVVAARAALDRGKNAAILLDIKNMSSSLEDFKNEYGAYPPNLMADPTWPTNSKQQIVNDAVKMLKKAFPRMNPQELAVLEALCGKTPVNTQIITSGRPVVGGITAAEAVVFWLGGYSGDDQFPLSGPGGPSFATDTDAGEVMENRKWRYQMDPSQLGPRTDDGFFDDSNERFIEYQVDMNNNGNFNDRGEQRRINLWHFKPSGSEQPYLYFDVSRYRPSQMDPWAIEPEIEPFICAIKQFRSGSTSTTPARRVQFVEQGKFQILHAGLDDAWGDFDLVKLLQRPGTVRTDISVDDMILYPAGPFTGELADTLTNFSDGTLEDAQEE